VRLLYALRSLVRVVAVGPVAGLAGLYAGFCGAVKASISLCLFLVCVY
jgi:hypothetical protein